VLYFGEEHEKTLLDLINLRIEYKLKKYRENRAPKKTGENILRKKEILRNQAEREILSRLNALRKYLRSPARDPHLSLEEIFRQRKRRKIKELLTPLMSYLHRRKGNQIKSVQE